LGFLSAFYAELMARRQSDGFSVKTLNVVRDATPLMKRIQGTSDLTAKSLLREHLASLGRHALPEASLPKVLREDLQTNINATKHLMSSMGWQKESEKWDGCRAVLTGCRGMNSPSYSHFLDSCN
jgi:hypothetical protein